MHFIMPNAFLLSSTEIANFDEHPFVIFIIPMFICAIWLSIYICGVFLVIALLLCYTYPSYPFCLLAVVLYGLSIICLAPYPWPQTLIPWNSCRPGSILMLSFLLQCPLLLLFMMIERHAYKPWTLCMHYFYTLPINYSFLQPCIFFLISYYLLIHAWKPHLLSCWCLYYYSSPIF